MEIAHKTSVLRRHPETASARICSGCRPHKTKRTGQTKVKGTPCSQAAFKEGQSCSDLVKKLSFTLREKSAMVVFSVTVVALAAPPGGSMASRYPQFTKPDAEGSLDWSASSNTPLLNTHCGTTPVGGGRKVDVRTTTHYTTPDCKCKRSQVTLPHHSLYHFLSSNVVAHASARWFLVRVLAGKKKAQWRGYL